MPLKSQKLIVLPLRSTIPALRIAILAVTTAFAAAGCTGLTSRLGPDDGGGLTTGVSPQDFRSVAQRMARSLIAHPAIQESSSPPRVVLLKLENHSDDYNVNGAMFLSKMQVELTMYSGGKIIFLDRANIGAIEQENQDKVDGKRQSTDPTIPYGAEYFLSGDLYSITQSAGKSATYFYQFMFKLTNASNSEIVWAAEYAIHKASLRGIMYD